VTVSISQHMHSSAMFFQAILHRARQRVAGYIFVLPALMLEGLFFGYPLLRTVYISLHDWPVLGAKHYIGLENYSYILSNDQFWEALRFTGLYTVVVTPAIFIVAFGLAVLVNQGLPGTTFFRSIYFVPVVISFVSSSLIWLWIYHDLYGILNYILRELHLITEPIVWMGERNTSLPAIVIMIVWKTAGFNMVILLAGMQSIPDQVYESAALDGANFVQRMRYITLPLLRPSFALGMVVSVAGSVLAFDQFKVMTRGGPANTTRTIMMYIYDTSFAYFRLGEGAAMAILLMVMLIALSVVQLRVLERQAVEY
jgi:multiple sugar transport system permease protein